MGGEWGEGGVGEGETRQTIALTNIQTSTYQLIQYLGFMSDFFFFFFFGGGGGGFIFLNYSVGCFSTIIWTPAVLRV